MTPFTKKLVPKASPVPCADIAYPQFLIGENEWANYRGAPMMDTPKYLDPQDPVWNLGFVDLQERRAKGIYTPEQLEDAHRAMLFPRMEEFIIQQIIAEGTLNHKSSVW